jgi:hypothetical protein
MNPQIGAALIAVGGALIGAIGVIAGVYLTVRGARRQKRGELAAAALSDYMKALAASATASERRIVAGSLPDGDHRRRILEEADRMQRDALEVARHAKTVLLAFADVDALHDLARWDTNATAADPAQQRVLLEVLNSIRRQIDADADPVPESVGLGLMFGSSD